jgi:glutamate--cysteine ligase
MSAATGPPFSEADAERWIGAISFKTGPPGIIGTELEWLVSDPANPSLPVPLDRVRTILSSLGRPGAMPAGGRLTLEPGGQVELSTAPAPDLAACVAAASADLAVLRAAFGSAGLILLGHGIDPLREPRRVLDLPRYAAMEHYFDRRGPWGRVMMCSTASVQVCLDAGLDDDGALGYRFRWRLLHAIGPVLVAAFANSPVRRGRPTGWKCTRQLVWSRLDPCRTSAPAGAEPAAPDRADRDPWADGDPRADWARYAMSADLLCLRQADGQPWTAPTGITLRDWLRDQQPPTPDDLRYHLSTLFPPVRARGHLELRMIDAQPGEGWIVPVALVAALAEDPIAAAAAMAAAEPVWQCPAPSPWLRAARHGLADAVLATAATQCFDAAAASLARCHAPPHIQDAVMGFAERYVRRGRCPADDVLDSTAVPTMTGPEGRT